MSVDEISKELGREFDSDNILWDRAVVGISPMSDLINVGDRVNVFFDGRVEPEMNVEVLGILTARGIRGG